MIKIEFFDGPPGGHCSNGCSQYDITCKYCCFTAGEDYTPLIDGELVVFAPGEFTKTVTVDTLSDITAEGTEIFNGNFFVITDDVEICNPQAMVFITEEGTYVCESFIALHTPVFSIVDSLSFFPLAH